MTSLAFEARAFFLVAGDTPAHLQRRHLLNGTHFLNLPVTLLAIKACSDVLLVCEVHVVGKIVDFGPFDWFVVVVFLCQLFDRFEIDTSQSVTSHARVGRRNTGGRCFSRARVTVLAWDLSVARMILVTELNRLRRMIANVFDGVAWRPEPPTSTTTQTQKAHHQPYDFQLMCDASQRYPPTAVS